MPIDEFLDDSVAILGCSDALGSPIGLVGFSFPSVIPSSSDSIYSISGARGRGIRPQKSTISPFVSLILDVCVGDEGIPALRRRVGEL